MRSSGRFITFAILSAGLISLPRLNAQTDTPFTAQPETHKERAAEELKQEEQQRILGVMPDFNTVYDGEAEALTAGQKFNLAEHGILDPFTFATAGIDAGLGQTSKAAFYGQGFGGFSKRFVASYADAADSTLIGNAVLPSLLHQDPRYFRKGTGSFGSRLVHALSSTVECKNDNGKWTPNYSNLLGNVAAGTISNLYYPEDQRGFGLTMQRSLAVTAEGALGAVFAEFWPDISNKMFRSHKP